ncbi:MAG: LPS export ABC transporter permease LptF [Deltaproteobacteria bacterium]|nr:LPS export ABC transporter permease LptF [Deltaproteobacteria bacterium]
MPRLINTYIFKEISVPFLLSLVIMTFTGLLSKVMKLVELMVTHGIGASFVFWFIVSVIPSFIIYTIPVSFLIGVLVAFTRLSSDSEITAMKSTGLSLFSLMRPVAVLAVIAYLLTLAFTIYIFPWGNLKLKQLLFEAAKTKLVSGIEEKTFYDKFKGMILYVDHLSPKTGEMEGIFISETGEGGETNIFFAEKGVFSPSTQEFNVYLKLLDGSIHRKTENDGSYHIVEFKDYVLDLSLSGKPTTGLSDKSNRELYLKELLERVAAAKERGQSAAPYLIDLHKRFALPASVFVFAILGVPLGIQKIRAARFTGFSISLGVVLIYYVTSTALEALGENGKINPVFAVWGSDIIFLTAGAYIFYKAAKDSPINILSWAGSAKDFILRKKPGSGV